MAHAGPSSKKPAKQKQDAKRTKKSVLGRQAVELLEKAALEYVRARQSLLRPVLIESTLGPRRRPQSFLGFADIGSNEERVKEVFLRRDDGHSNSESTCISQGQGRLGRCTDREREDLSVLDTCSRDSLSQKMGSSRWPGSSRDFTYP